MIYRVSRMLNDTIRHSNDGNVEDQITELETALNEKFCILIEILSMSKQY